MSITCPSSSHLHHIPITSSSSSLLQIHHTSITSLLHLNHISIISLLQLITSQSHLNFISITSQSHLHPISIISHSHLYCVSVTSPSYLHHISIISQLHLTSKLHLYYISITSLSCLNHISISESGFTCIPSFQMYSSTELQRPSEVVLNESVPNEQVRTAAKSRKHKSIVPAAHLPVRPTSRNTQRDVHANVIHWNPDQGSLHHFGYHNGRVLVEESGLYYVYAKTCFRYYDIIEVASETEQDSQSNGPPTISPSDAGMQLVQYVFREHVSRGRSGPVLLMKSGHTWHWKQGTWHTCCQRQSGVFALQSGDGLYVSILNIWVLDPDTEGSYFGAFMVSGEQ
ncbi:uncharacterized protein LOC143522183 isoform X1 [Brachyhypopomus gauderio]|uniref:uncharacterized protein LOC143522183 isoform X1 n=1 Tax=Brachyhypopomus gauderio TaxID=698409 RepID=UPI004043284B